MLRKTLNPDLLKEAENQFLLNVLFTPKKEIDDFLKNINHKVDEAAGEKTIGKLTLLQTAYFAVAKKQTDEAKKKTKAFNALSKSKKDADYEEVNAEVRRLKKEADLLRKFGWALVRDALAKAGSAQLRTIGYRDGGVIVSVREEEFDGIIIIPTPFGFMVGM